MSKHIRNIVKEIQNEIKSLNYNDFHKIEIHILNKFPDFYDKYPFLVKKICKNDNIDLLFKMLDKINDVENGNDNMKNVEYNLGKELADTYLYPNLKK